MPPLHSSPLLQKIYPGWTGLKDGGSLSHSAHISRGEAPFPSTKGQESWWPWILPQLTYREEIWRWEGQAKEMMVYPPPLRERLLIKHGCLSGEVSCCPHSQLLCFGAVSFQGKRQVRSTKVRSTKISTAPPEGILFGTEHEECYAQRHCQKETRAWWRTSMRILIGSWCQWQQVKKQSS